MTDKQLRTILLFAKGYNLGTIARKNHVCLGTIRDRLNAINRHYPTEFENACSIRNCYKRSKYNLSCPEHLDTGII